MDVLLRLGWHVTEDGYNDAIADDVKMSTDAIVKQLLNTDTKEFGAPCLENCIKEKRELKASPIIVQLIKLRNVTAPKVNENSSSFPKLFKLIVTDGHYSCAALVMRDIPGITLETPPGTKLLLRNRLEVEHGILLLNEQNCQVLGGKVDHLIEKWKINKEAQSSTFRQKMGAGDPPPAWLPFGQKVTYAQGLDSSKFTSLGVSASENAAGRDGSSEFEKSRQQVIAEISNDATSLTARHKFDSARPSVQVSQTTGPPGSAGVRTSKTQKDGKPIAKDTRKCYRDVDDSFTVGGDDRYNAAPTAKSTLLDFLDEKIVTAPSGNSSSRNNSTDTSDTVSAQTYQQPYQKRADIHAKSGDRRYGQSTKGGASVPVRRGAPSLDLKFQSLSLKNTPRGTDPSSSQYSSAFPSLSGGPAIVDNNHSSLMHNPKPISHFQIGEHCMAKFRGDGQLYLAKITSVDNARAMCKVLFVDYGDVQTVSSNDLVALS